MGKPQQAIELTNVEEATEIDLSQCSDEVLERVGDKLDQFLRPRPQDPV